MALTCIDQADILKKRVLCRFDFNVPFEVKDGKKVISDTYRLDIALPTIKYLIDNGAKKIILMSHLGRPKGKKDNKFSLEPVANYLAEKLNQEVYLSESSVDAGVDVLLNLGHVKIILLENLRFNKEETENSSDFAHKLSTYGDIYLNDAFGACHRKHASVDAITTYYDKKDRYCGFLMKKEVQALKRISGKPEKPFTAIIGGAKVSDKIQVLEKLLTQATHLLIGGAMAYPFLKAKGIKVSDSLCFDEDVLLAKNLLKRDVGHKIKLPLDHIIYDDKEVLTTGSQSIDTGFKGMDIGPKTLNLYAETIKKSKTIFWNGPMGLFEDERFSKGTFYIAQEIAESSAYSIVGGGDSVSALRKSKHQDNISHVSSGGGASLEFIQSGNLSGIQKLMFHS